MTGRRSSPDHVLCVNVGSSSLKLALFVRDGEARRASPRR